MNKVKCLHSAIESTVKYYTENLADEGQEMAICKKCGNEIHRFSFYDEDRGFVWVSWA